MSEHTPADDGAQNRADRSAWPWIWRSLVALSVLFVLVPEAIGTVLNSDRNAYWRALAALLVPGMVWQAISCARAVMRIRKGESPEWP